MNSRRERIGWYFYDWANSAFPATVVTVFLGPWLTTVTKAAAGADGFVYPLGIKVHAGSFFPYVVSLSVLVQVVVLPILGAVAASSHRKKEMLALFAYAGAGATLGLWSVDGTRYLPGGVLFLIANVSFGASVVFYNAFLPEIAPPDRRNAVSSTGWALGYLGGGLLLALNLALFSHAAALGLSTGGVVRLNLASAGAWWAVFTLIPLLTLRNRAPARLPLPGQSYLTVGFRQLRRTLGDARRYPQTVLFLGAYLFYNDGIQTVIALASQFGQEELGLPISTLTAVILMVQFVAFLGSLLFERVAAAIGTKRAVVVSLVIWTATVTYAYGWLRTGAQFFVLGAVIALVLGGSQALSRALYSHMIPKGQEAEYFSLYEVSERGTSWLGPLLFGLALQLTGSYRIAILSLSAFFLLGLAILLRVDVRRAVVEAGNEPPAGL